MSSQVPQHQKEFLSNDYNKVQLIDKLAEVLIREGHTAVRAENDADTDIVLLILHTLTKASLWSLKTLTLRSCCCILQAKVQDIYKLSLLKEKGDVNY